MKKLPVYEMLIDENMDSDLMVDFIALVDRPAIKKDFVKFSDEFVEPAKGEHETEFMPRCISYVVNEGKSNEQAVAICSSMWQQHFAVGVTHYTKDGKPYTGPTHKDADGRLMTGETHTDESEYLYHIEELAEVGPRGGIRESDKAPKSGTANKDPKGEGSAKGSASGKRGAVVTAGQEETLKNKIKDFNEKESNTKNGNATLGALKAVFQRGLGAFNTSHSPVVRSAEQWAFARVNAFLYLLKNGRPENAKYNTDFDLLPKGHPKFEMSDQSFMDCSNCQHSWDLSNGGENPYKCHMCGYDNKPMAFVESWNDYPEAAVENAKTALRWADENGWGDCGEATGKIRANQIAGRQKLTRETIARMSAFQRHRQNSDRALGDGCGRLMWLSWGGDEGIAWAERKLEQIDRKGFAIQDEEKRIISGPLMIANQKIFRTDPEMGDYEVYFSPDTIKKIAIKMAKKGFHNNVNLMHNSEMKVSGVTLFEVFQSDKTRGIRPMKGFEDLADGTLFGSMYVENPVAWQMIKDGFIKGFSVEGNFGMKKKDEYLEQFQKIVEILNSTTF